jgi:predicted nuclease of predicted toxin-antitoxin system
VNKIKLFLDEDVHAVLSTILQKRGLDVEHAQEMEKKGMSDTEQLTYAVQNNGV